MYIIGSVPALREENQLLQMEEFQLLLLSESSRQPDDSDADG